MSKGEETGFYYKDSKEPILIGDKVRYYYPDGDYTLDMKITIEKDSNGELNIDSRDSYYLTKII